MSDLVEFLLARIAEDEGVARLAQHRGDSTPGISYRTRDTGLGVPPPRVLAECEAKRRIISIYIDPALYLNDDGDVLGGDGPETHWETLRHLAAVYADHPDYDEAWRP